MKLTLGLLGRCIVGEMLRVIPGALRMSKTLVNTKIYSEFATNNNKVAELESFNSIYFSNLWIRVRPYELSYDVMLKKVRARRRI